MLGYRDDGNPLSVRPEPVEGLFFLQTASWEGMGFDKLSPNGVGG